MRAELATITGRTERLAFARSTSRVALLRGLGARVGLGILAGALIALITWVASRAQLADAQPGVAAVTVPLPAVVLMVNAALAAAVARSRRVGVQAGLVGLATGFAGLVVMLTVEGRVWMDRHGVFILDADPPRRAVTTTDLALDLFTTGMWMGHVAFWVPAIVIGALLGGAIGRRRGRDLAATAG